MSNHKFKLSDLIPNAWFHKFRGMNKVKNHYKITKSNSSNHLSTSKYSNQTHLTDQRKSYHFSRDLTDDLHSNSPIKTFSNLGKKFAIEPTLKSSKRRKSIKGNKLGCPPISKACSCGSIDSLWTKRPPEYSSPEQYSSSGLNSDRAVTPDSLGKMDSLSRKCECNIIKNDTVIVLDYDCVPELAPIITKKQNVQKKCESTTVSNHSYQLRRSFQQDYLPVRAVKKNVLSSTSTKTKRFSGNSSSLGLKLRTNSPRIANKRIQTGRKSFSSKSFAVVKSSRNPCRDFRESMEEMILENNIRESKDLEDLLACYLSLNSDEYHELIISVFKQIWYDSARAHIK